MNFKSIKTFLFGPECPHCADLDEQVIRLKEQRNVLSKQLDDERMRLAACGVAAMSNTDNSARMHRLEHGNRYASGSYDEVCHAVDREMRYREIIYHIRAFFEHSSDARLIDLAKMIDEMVKGVDGKQGQMCDCDGLAKVSTEAANEFNTHHAEMLAEVDKWQAKCAELEAEIAALKAKLERVFLCKS